MSKLKKKLETVLYFFLLVAISVLFLSLYINLFLHAGSKNSN